MVKKKSKKPAKKIKNNKNPKGAGRKWFDAKDEAEEKLIISKLEQAWANGCSDREAALFAEISLASLNRYIVENPEIKTRRDLLKDTPVLLARSTIVKAIKENPSDAWRYLKIKRRKEFAEEKPGEGGEGLTVHQMFIQLVKQVESGGVLPVGNPKEIGHDRDDD